MPGRKQSSPPEAAPGSRERPLVLIVDDYEDAREICRDYLVYSGFDVGEAKDGLEAIEKTIELLPDIVLMDLSLPNIDGWEATRRLKAETRTRNIPVVALTGHAMEGQSESAREAGCDSYLTKPCLPDAILAEIRRILKLDEDNARPKKKKN